LQSPAARVLASASATRQEILRRAGLIFEAVAADVDEAAIKSAARRAGGGAGETALQLAECKALRVSRQRPEALVIGADQLLVCGERWFDKPANLGEAREHLLALRGRRHTLVTAVTCLCESRVLWRHVARPQLVMRDFSESFLDAYLALEGEALTAAVGCYRLEGLGVHLFATIAGEHSAILGLPLLPLLGFLRRQGALAG
jgi:septum formation protein